MRAAQKLLALLAERIPQQPPARHNLALDGDRLAVWIKEGEIWHSFLLDDKDLDKPPEELVEEITRLWETVRKKT